MHPTKYKFESGNTRLQNWSLQTVHNLSLALFHRSTGKADVPDPEISKLYTARPSQEELSNDSNEPEPRVAEEEVEGVE